MATINDQLTEIYTVVDHYLKAHPQLAQWRHSPNATPLFNATPLLTDAQVLTIALMQGAASACNL